MTASPELDVLISGLPATPAAEQLGDLLAFPVPREVDPIQLGSASLALAEVLTPDTLNPYRVDMKPEALIRDLLTVVQEEREKTGEQNRIAAIRIEQNSPFADVARFIEAREFKAAWYQTQGYSEFARTMEEEYAPYDEDSKFIVLMDTEALDEDGLPILVGMARVAGGRLDLIKTLQDMPEVWGVSQEDILTDLKRCTSKACEGIDVGDPSKTWDYSSLAVAKDYRGSDAYSIISHELYKWSLENNITTVTTILVEGFFKLYQQRGVPFRAICGVSAREHMDAISVPVVMHIPEDPAMDDSDDPRVRAAYQQLAFGKSLDYLKITV